MPFIAYETLWTEGTVVAHTDDKEFALGYDGATGNILYGSYDKLKTMKGFRIMVQFDDEKYVRQFDTALYPRHDK